MRAIALFCSLAACGGSAPRPSQEASKAEPAPASEPIHTAASLHALVQPATPLALGPVGECNKVIEVINAEQEPLKNATGSDPEALYELAAMLERVAARTAAVWLQDERLAGLRDGYARMALDLARASRDTSEALLADDPKAAADAAKNMSSFGPRESALVDDINAHCQAVGEAREKKLVSECDEGKTASCAVAGAQILDDEKAAAEEGERARELLAKACKGGHEPSCGLERSAAREEAARIKQRAELFLCRERSAHACVAAAAHFYAAGHKAGAVQLWSAACEAGEGEGCTLLLQHYRQEPRAERASARALFVKSCESGQPSACDAAGALTPPDSCGATGRPPEELQRAVADIARTTRACYRRALARDPKLSLRFTMRLSIGLHGRVTGAAPLGDPPSAPELVRCVADRFASFGFPAPAGGCVVVDVPLSFTQKDTP